MCLQRLPAFDHTVAPFHYRYPVDSLIKKFKYDEEIRAAGPLVACLLKRINERTPVLPEVLIPIPLHRNRLYLRGYNQSQEICRILGHHLDIPVDNKSVVRARSTAEQHRLSAKQRRGNVRGAFRIQTALAYRSVAIVDDVITTGATANEMAATLKRAGVKRVELWALARAGTGT